MGALALAFQTRRGIGRKTAERPSITTPSVIDSSVARACRRRSGMRAMTPESGSRRNLRIDRPGLGVRVRPGVELGDVVADVAAVLAVSRPLAGAAHALEGAR